MSGKYGAALCLSLCVFLLGWWWIELRAGAIAGVVALALMLWGEWQSEWREKR